MSENMRSFGGEEIKEESSWRYPFGIFLATLGLSAVFLYYYLGPRLEDIAGDAPKPTISDEMVTLRIGGVDMRVRASYTVYPRARRGGERDEVFLYAMLPNMSPYSPGRRRDFTENAPNTRRVDIRIGAASLPYSEEVRFQRIYLPLTLDEAGEETEIGLRRYEFGESLPNATRNAYANEDLFVGRDADGAFLALRCFKEREDIPSPYCRRDYGLNNGLSVTYQFKRPYLDEWLEIDAAVRAFVDQLFVEEAQ